MTIVVSSVVPGGGKLSGPEAELAAEYVLRAGRYASCRAQTYRSQEMLLAAVAQARRQRSLRVALLDVAGVMLSSEDFAGRIRQFRDSGVQEVWAAVGPPDGWSDATLAQADVVLSLGPMTLPHRLAFVVLAEQIYRALTILAGHPYHHGR